MSDGPSRAAPSLRRATADDESFLRRLHAETHPEFGSSLPPTVAAGIVGQQFELRERQYRDRHPAMVDHVIEVGGLPVGRLTTAEWDGSIVVVDIAVLPDVQGSGVGSAALTHVLAQADAEGVAVVLSVAADSRAVAWYERHGFTPSPHPDNAAYLGMRRHPVGPVSAS